MLRDDNGNGGGRSSTLRNVLGERLEVCSISPMTGFFRDGWKGAFAAISRAWWSPISGLCAEISSLRRFRRTSLRR